MAVCTGRDCLRAVQQFCSDFKTGVIVDYDAHAPQAQFCELMTQVVISAACARWSGVVSYASARRSQRIGFPRAVSATGQTSRKSELLSGARIHPRCFPHRARTRVLSPVLACGGKIDMRLAYHRHAYLSCPVFMLGTSTDMDAVVCARRWWPSCDVKTGLTGHGSLRRGTSASTPDGTAPIMTTRVCLRTNTSAGAQLAAGDCKVADHELPCTALTTPSIAVATTPTASVSSLSYALRNSGTLAARGGS
jgi:hypothetical protein